MSVPGEAPVGSSFWPAAGWTARCSWPIRAVGARWCNRSTSASASPGKAVEEEHLRRFLDSLPADCRARPLVALEFPVADVYGAHWSVSGAEVPDEDTPDSAVYLPGRNLLLLAKSSVWCALNDFGVVALGTLKGNPFADSGAEFFDGLASLASLALDRPLAVETPFAGFTKVEVLERGRHLALELTFSCIEPQGGEHCGRCNKCAERRRAFAASGLADRTAYADR